MRAALNYGEKDYRIEQIEAKKPGPGEVRVEPAFCGICGTDLHEWDGGPNFAPVPGKEHLITGEHIPIGVGHEFSGTVVEVGPGVSDSLIGTRAAIFPLIYCSRCQGCDAGAPMACDGVGFIGLSGGGGGLSDSLVVASDRIVKLPDNVPLEHGALVEPLSVGWHAASASGMRGGDQVLIFGGGPIGLATLQAVKARKAKTVIVAEVSKSRQQFASKFGADHVLNPINDDVVARSKDLCGGVLPDVVFDAAGVPASIRTACAAVKPRGTIVNIAIFEKPIPFQPNDLVMKEANYRGIIGYAKTDFEYVVGALGSGAIDPDSMITKKIRMEDLVEEGIKTLIADKDSHIKILVDVKS